MSGVSKIYAREILDRYAAENWLVIIVQYMFSRSALNRSQLEPSPNQHLS